MGDLVVGQAIPNSQPSKAGSLLDVLRQQVKVRDAEIALLKARANEATEKMVASSGTAAQYMSRADKLRGQVAAMRDTLQWCRDILCASDRDCDNCEFTLQEEEPGAEICQLRHALVCTPGAREAATIKAAVEQAKAHEYNLNADQEEIGRQVLAYERACQMTNVAAADMQEG